MTGASSSSSGRARGATADSAAAVPSLIIDLSTSKSTTKRKTPDDARIQDGTNSCKRRPIIKSEPDGEYGPKQFPAIKAESDSDEDASRYPTNKPGAASGSDIPSLMLANTAGNKAVRRSRRLTDMPQRPLPRPLTDAELDGDTDIIELPRRKFAHIGPVPNTDDDSEDEYRLPTHTPLPSAPVSDTEEPVIYGEYGSELPDDCILSSEHATPPVPHDPLGLTAMLTGLTDKRLVVHNKRRRWTEAELKEVETLRVEAFGMDPATLRLRKKALAKELGMHVSRVTDWLTNNPPRDPSLPALVQARFSESERDTLGALMLKRPTLTPDEWTKARMDVASQLDRTLSSINSWMAQQKRRDEHLSNVRQLASTGRSGNLTEAEKALIVSEMKGAGNNQSADFLKGIAGKHKLPSTHVLRYGRAVSLQTDVRYAKSTMTILDGDTPLVPMVAAVAADETFKFSFSFPLPSRSRSRALAIPGLSSTPLKLIPFELKPPSEINQHPDIDVSLKRLLYPDPLGSAVLEDAYGPVGTARAAILRPVFTNLVTQSRTGVSASKPVYTKSSVYPVLERELQLICDAFGAGERPPMDTLGEAYVTPFGSLKAPLAVMLHSSPLTFRGTSIHKPYNGTIFA